MTSIETTVPGTVGSTRSVASPSGDGRETAESNDKPTLLASPIFGTGPILQLSELDDKTKVCLQHQGGVACFNEAQRKRLQIAQQLCIRRLVDARPWFNSVGSAQSPPAAS